MDWQAAANVAGVAGLALATYTFITDRLQNRCAEVEVRFRAFDSISGAGKPSKQYRLVIENRGPNKAKQVEVSILSSDGESMPSGTILLGADEPFDVVWPRQIVEVNVIRSWGNQDARFAEIRWGDGRFKRQSRRYLISFIHD